MAFGINLGQLANSFVGHQIGAAGHLISNVGTALHAPQLAPGGLGAQLQNIGGNLVPRAHASSGNASQPNSIPNFSGTTGSVVNGVFYAPSTGGGSPSGGGGGTGYGSNLGTVNLQTPNFSDTNPSQGDTLNLLNQQYDQAAQDIAGQGPALDSTYNLAKGDINNAEASAQQKAEGQKTANEKTYGDVLKQAVQTYNELKQRQQGTFSALGTLDSSAYQDATAKADQGVADQTTGINMAKAGSNNNIDSQLNDYVNGANSQLATLGIQYQQGKDAIASAMAHNRLDQAQAIQDAMSQIRANAQAIANNMINFQNQAALLKAQGLNVQTNIAGQDATPFAQQVGQQLAGIANKGAAIYQTPSASTTTGYLGGQTKNKIIDPITGLPVATA